MRFLILSDIHGSSEYLDKLNDELKKADAVLFAGDFARFEPGKNIPPAETAIPVLDALLKKHDKIFAVTGNCDDPSFKNMLEQKDISVEAALVYDSGLFFCGSGGGMRFTGATPYERSDEELTADLETAKNSQDKNTDTDGWNNLIIIAHNPPKDTKLDMINTGIHVGSPGMRQFIEEIKPLLVISGHIHESYAVDSLNGTVLINPGSLAEGRYAIAEITENGGRKQVSRAELREIH